jgi:hypothetical protein
MLNFGQFFVLCGLIILQSAMGASAQTNTVYVHPDRSPVLLSVEYEGEGWRNLRRIQVVTEFNGERGERGWWVACHSDLLIQEQEPRFVEPGSNRVRGIPAGATYIPTGIVHRGAILELNPGGFRLNRDFDRLQARELTSALRRLCQSGGPSVVIEPEWLVTWESTTAIAFLVPQRLERNGSRVVWWERIQPIERVTAESEFLGSWSGFNASLFLEDSYSLWRVIGDCDAGAARVVRRVVYSESGAVLSSQSDDGPLEETVPGSTGENALRIACAAM